MTTTTRAAVALTVALLTGAAAGTAGATAADDPDPAAVPTTAPAPAVPTTFDNTSGPLSTPAAGGTLPVYATCEEAIQPPTSTEPCSEAAVDAFNRFGGKLGLLYASDLPISLGVWSPIGDHDWEFNQSVLYACIGVARQESEYAWLDYQLMTFTDYSAVANEKLFDAAMTYVCPELSYTRQNEWDFHVPAEVLASTTTVAPTPPTEPVATAGPTAAVTVPEVPTVPTVPAVPTTIGGVIPTVATTVPGTTAEATAPIQTANGIHDYTCAQIVSIRSEQPCDAAIQGVFDQIVAGNPQAFDDYIYTADLGWFSSNELNVPETAFVGLMACANRASGLTYDGFDPFVRGIFPAAGQADTRKAWDAAGAVLCPFLGS